MRSASIISCRFPCCLHSCEEGFTLHTTSQGGGNAFEFRHGGFELFRSERLRSIGKRHLGIGVYLDDQSIGSCRKTAAFANQDVLRAIVQQILRRQQKRVDRCAWPTLEHGGMSGLPCRNEQGIV